MNLECYSDPESRLIIDSLSQNSQETLCCANALIQYLIKQEINSHFLKITKVGLLNLQDFMQISSEAFSSLCIFESKTHPNMHSPRSKEFGSLFALIDKTKTAMGKLLLRSWFVSPLQKIDIISERQDYIQIFTDASNLNYSKELRSSLKKIPNIPTLLKRLIMQSKEANV